LEIAELLNQPETYVSFFTLLLMEVVLGIDNIVFITILAGKLPREQQLKARRIGVTVALVSRIALLFALSWVIGLKEPLFDAFGHTFTGRGIILSLGGLFLIAKATREIYENVEHVPPHPEHDAEAAEAGSSQLETAASRRLWTSIIIQILILDVVFSLDSVITAVGMAEHIPVMIAAMVGAVLIMLIFIGPVGDFVEQHATIRVLALAFLVLIGVMLLVEGMGGHVSKGYIYFAMAFSLSIELVNMRMRTRQ
jgi:predicted tellurium resistance membrane protein TerC